MRASNSSIPKAWYVIVGPGVQRLDLGCFLRRPLKETISASWRDRLSVAARAAGHRYSALRGPYYDVRRPIAKCLEAVTPSDATRTHSRATFSSGAKPALSALIINHQDALLITHL